MPRMCWLIFILVFGSVPANSTYLATFSNSLIPGVPLDVRFHVLGASSGVSATATLQYASNNTAVAKTTTSVQEGVPKTIHLQVPVDLLPAAYVVSITGSGGAVFSNHSTIEYVKNSLLLYIQTDKVRYSSGQTVRYRVVTLLPNLKAFTGNVSVDIHDGKDNRIEFSGPIQSANGVINGSIKLSTEPVFGTWKIVARARDQTVEKPFEVNSYVLPKFVVNIEVPDTVLRSDSDFQVRVTSRYTFNTDVHGNCSLQIYKEGNLLQILEYSQQIVGAVNFTVIMSDLKNKLGYPSKIVIRAIVTDNATLISMATEKDLAFSQQTSTYTPPISIRRTDSRDTFVPGITYRTFLFIGRGDEPLGFIKNMNVSVIMTTARVQRCTGYPDYDWLDTQTLKLPDTVISNDNTGYALLEIPNVPEYAEKIDVTVKDGSGTKIDMELYSVFNNPAMMLRVTPNNPIAKVGTSIPFTILSTKPISGLITAEAYSRGYSVGEATVHGASATTNTFSLTMTPDMVPEVYVLVSHTTTDGVIIADYVLLRVEGEPFNTKINVSYSASELKPGQQIQLTMTGTPNSSVYMLVQDERNRLLGTENDIFVYEVRNDALKFDVDTDENISRYPKQFGKRNNVRRRRGYRTAGAYANVYRDSGVIYLTDGSLFQKTTKDDLDMYRTQLPLICTTPTTTTMSQTLAPGFTYEPNKIPTPAPGQTYAPGNYPTWVPGMIPTPAPGMTYAPNNIPTPASGQGAALQGLVVRSRFPETWIWDTYTIGSSGVLTVDMNVPDSVTSWITSAFAMNTDIGFGIDDTKEKITVKRLFFITMDLPEEMIIGEEFLLQVTVFNYLPTSQMVFLQVLLSDDPSNPIPSSAKIDPGQGYSTYVPVTPKDIGTLKINVVARSGSLFTVTATDGLEKQVSVIPPGARVTKNEQHLVHLSASNPVFTKTVVMTADPHIINGTRLTKVSLTGNFMIPSIDGLQSLISLPFGCGEQTMLNFAPDIYIAKYLKTVGKLTENVKRRSESYLQSGLQREMTYQHRDGSFSAFGDRDTSGSSWLTAFVMKCFQQARDLIKIDETLSKKAMEWLLRYQHSDGSFYEPGRIIHTQMQAGTSSGMKLTAFILASVLENKYLLGTQGTQVVEKAKNYLESRLNNIRDVYTLALVCYTLTKAGSSRQLSCVSMIESAAIRETETTHWEAHAVVGQIGRKRTLASRAPSADIEATSYILLTYLAAGRSDEGFPIVKWLVSQRNPQGGFQSTQDTVISLQALSEYSAMHTAGDPSSQVNFNMLDFGTGFRHTYTISAGNVDVVHEIEVPNNAQNIVVQATGSGTAVFDVVCNDIAFTQKLPGSDSINLAEVRLVKVIASYHVTAMPSGTTIDVSAPITHESLNAVHIKPCISWSDSQQSGQLLMEVEMPTGFVADSELLKADHTVKKHEMNGRKLVLYFDEVPGHGSVCTDVTMTRSDPVVKSQACHVIAYDYYNPVNQAMAMYESGILKRATVCNVCPQCNFCSGNVGAVIVG